MLAPLERGGGFGRQLFRAEEYVVHDVGQWVAERVPLPLSTVRAMPVDATGMSPMAVSWLTSPQHTEQPMAQRRTITHAYRIPGGWQKHRRQLLTPDTARELKSLGFTLVRTKQRWQKATELSIAEYLRHHQ